MNTITNKAILEYRKYLAECEKSQATIEKYIRDVSMFATWLGKRKLGKDIVLKYKESLISKYAPASVNAALSSLNNFFAYNKWYHLKVKTIRIQKQLFMSGEKELTRAEYERLLIVAKQNGNEKLYYIMQTICATGIRVSELKFITVKSLYDKVASVNLKGKMRVIIIPSKLCKMLLKFAKKEKITCGSIFVSKNGSPIDRTCIWKVMKSLCEKAKVAKEKVFPHNLRHLFARTFYEVQKDIVRLADILGHTNVNTTRIYTMETGNVHRKQIETLKFLRC